MLDALIAGERDPADAGRAGQGHAAQQDPATGRRAAGPVHRASRVHGREYLIADRHAHRGRSTRSPRGSRRRWCPFAASRDADLPPRRLRPVADVIIAETGGDMSVFDTPGHLASWAGVCPARTSPPGASSPPPPAPADKYLKGALGTAALSVVPHQGTPTSAPATGASPRAVAPSKPSSRSSTPSSSPSGTCSATARLHTTPAPDFYTHRHPGRAQRRAVRELEALGYTVTLDKAS